MKCLELARLLLAGNKQKPGCMYKNFIVKLSKDGRQTGKLALALALVAKLVLMPISLLQNKSTSINFNQCKSLND